MLNIVGTIPLSRHFTWHLSLLGMLNIVGTILESASKLASSSLLGMLNIVGTIHFILTLKAS